jgi:hypothetical protein
MEQDQPQSPLTRHQIIDQQHGLVAAVLEHLASWQAQSQIVWNFEHYSLPVRVSGRVFDPRSLAQVEFFPAEQFCWVEPDLGLQQQGQDAGGVTLLQPLPAADALLRWVLPKYRGQMQGLRIAGVTPLPQLAALLNASNPTQGVTTEGVRVDVEYSDQGRTFAEEFYGLKFAAPGIPTYGAAGTLVQYNWGFARLLSFRAPAGQLDEHRRAFWAVVRSLRVNPQWEQLCAQVFQQLKQQFDQYLQAGYANIEAAGRLSRQISAQNDAWLGQQQQQRDAARQADQQRRAQEQSAAGTYTTNDAFGDYIMGRETYDDPYYQYGSQHSGYHDYVWTDGQGSYQYSNDANFDPNIGASTNWTLMKKKQIGD